MARPNRLETRLTALRAKGQKAFVTFITAGFPDAENSARLLSALPAAGVDIIEIGVPFSDPMADGPVIQAANNVALKDGMNLPRILDMVRTFREEDQETPILLMGYYNPFYSYGIERFLDDAQQAGVDGFIVPDLPPEEDAELREPALKRDMNVIRLITPTTDEKRMDVILKEATGFLYFVSVAGITGGKTAQASSLTQTIKNLRARSELPVAIGFGVSTPEQARAMAREADGVIVGSAILSRLSMHMDDHGLLKPTALSDTLSFIRSLADGVHT